MTEECSCLDIVGEDPDCVLHGTERFKMIDAILIAAADCVLHGTERFKTIDAILIAADDCVAEYIARVRAEAHAEQRAADVAALRAEGKRVTWNDRHRDAVELAAHFLEQRGSK